MDSNKETTYNEMTNKVIDKLYLRGVDAIKTKKIRLNPIRQKEFSKPPTEQKTLNSCKSVPDLFRGLNGTVIIQNWNTKKNIPKDIGEYINLPSLIDRNKIPKIDAKNLLSKNNLTLLEKIHLANYNKDNESLKNDSKNNFYKINLNNRPILSRHSMRSNSTASLQKYDVNLENDQKNSLIPFSQISDEKNELAKMKIKKKLFKKDQKKLEIIDFSTFKKHLFLRDNDFLYAKRVGGPVDFALCSYQEINTRINFDYSKISILHKKNSNVISKSVEYITISKNTIIHYQKGIPHLYSIAEWTDNYIKFKKLKNIPLFKNFKNAGLFDLWKRYYRKKKRMYYTEKLNKKSFYVDINLLNGILEIRRILKEMTIYDIFKVNIPSPVDMSKFKEIYENGQRYNLRKIETFRLRIKKELSYACDHSYKEFKIAKNITLDDPYTENNDDYKDDKKQKNEKEENKDENDKQKNKAKASSNLKSFIKDAIPYAQDATRKRHFKKLLKFIRSIDFLLNDTKFKLIIFSLRTLDKKFKRLYESYVNSWVDSPLFVVRVFPLGDKLSCNPSIDLIHNEIFEHFIQDNIYSAVYTKNYIDPQEYPQYMVCFEEVFEVSVDQNAMLNARIKDDEDFNELLNSIRINFDNCRKALEETAKKLTPSLVNNNKFRKINFTKVENEANHKELINYISEFKEENERVKKLEKKINIGIFEFQLEELIEEIVNIPTKSLVTIFSVIPKILDRKVNESTNEIEKSFNDINVIVSPGDVEGFIKLKKAVDKCTVKRNEIDEKMDEIRELFNITNNNKEIKLEDFEKRKYDNLLHKRTKYERILDSMIYFIEQNIKQYRADLMVKIKKYDAMLNKIHDELNNEKINNYNNDPMEPLLFLEDKSLLIRKAIDNKKIFQQQEIDIEMDESDKSNFENLDLVSYEYDLKTNLWKSLYDFQQLTVKWEKIQVMDLKLDIMSEKIKKWKELSIISIKDLDNANAAKEFLENVKKYENILHVLLIIQNNNIQKVDYLKELLKNALNLNINDFMENSFTLEKLMTREMEEIIPTLDEINKRANEEKRIKDIYKDTLEKFNTHHIPFKSKIDEKGNAKYIMQFVDFDNEQEFIQILLAILNKEMLNPYISVIQEKFEILINNLYKYQYFLEIFYDYELYLLKVDNLLNNTEFSKEFPSEFKKMTSDSITKSLTKTLKDSVNLEKYFAYAHERTISNLKTLINNYEINYKSIHQFLLRRRKECQEYYLLNDEDLLLLIELKDSYEIREKLFLKIYDYIEEINPGKEVDENIKIITKFNHEKLILKYIKTTRTFKDGIECIVTGINKKFKDFFKSFKKNFDASLKPKSAKKPKDLINDLFENKDVLNQTFFICFYHVTFYNLEKTLEKESEAFDKLFDYYHELKDEIKIKYLNMLIKNTEKNPIKTKFFISVISIIDYFIKSIENLLRDDVTKITDYSFSKVLQIKIENDLVSIKLIQFNLEYGNDYVGLGTDFFASPQTEKFLLSLLNVIHSHKNFLIYSNQKYFKKETMNMINNILGERILIFNCNEELNIEGFNNFVYGNMVSSQVICISNVEFLKNNLLQFLVDRISEIMRLLQCKPEDGIFNDYDGEKYIINTKKFNIFMSYNIDSIHMKNYDLILPYSLKNNFRVVGLNYIDYTYYLEIILNSYAISKSQEITKKIAFIINTLNSKSKILNKNNLKEHIWPAFCDSIKKEIILKRDEINKKTIYNIVKNCLWNIINPFIKWNNNEKEDIEILLNILLFDYDEKDKKNKIIKTTKKKEEEVTKNSVPTENNIIDDYDNIYDEALKKFSFGNNFYKSKIKELYESLNNNKSFVLLGPELSGKTNAIVTLREISLQLNKINNEKNPIFNYVKIYPNSKNYSDIFINNVIKVAHQTNNIFFKNIINILDERGTIYQELQEQYNKFAKAQGEKPKYIENTKTENEKKTNEENFSSNREIEKENLNNSVENDEKNNIISDNQENLEKDGSKIEEIIENSYQTIIFDGAISPLWYNYLVNNIDSNNHFTFNNGDYINLSENKFMYETASISNVSPSFVTKQNIISFDREIFNWLNIAYAFVEKNNKVSKNEELKNYIKGLFENYGASIIDFVEINKLKCISDCINKNFVIKNLINLFDAILPDYDFTDIKIGRRNIGYVPRIEVIKKQTLCIFIFCSSWVMNLATNFLIRNKIEKTISDLFKSDDLKGPIFDYYIDEENYNYTLWTQLMQEPKYKLPTYQKNTIYYYNHFFINTIENIPYQYIIDKLLLVEVPLLIISKPCGGKTTLINYRLNDLEHNLNEIKSIKINITHKTKTDEIEEEINNHCDKISRRVYGDKYLRKTVVFIDDVHINENRIQLNEYFRYLLNTKSTYNSKYNVMKYYKDFNIIISGNFYNTIFSPNNYEKFYNLEEYENNKKDFKRCINKFSVISLNLAQNNYTSLYKSTLEFHFRNYIPNTSNITANQYLSVLFKLNNILDERINKTYNNLHYWFTLRDITKIVQRFNMFIFRETNEYPEYIKKIFLYETYSLYTDKVNKDSDVEILKECIIESYNSFFKQDKLDISIFDNINNDDSYIYAKNFIDVYNENTENKYIHPRDMEYVYIDQKIKLKKYIIKNIKNFYNDYYYNGGVKGTEDTHYIINDYNNIMLDNTIQIMRILNNEYPNLILLGREYNGKELLLKLSLYLMHYSYEQINIDKLLSKNHNNKFEEETVHKVLEEVIFNNKKVFLIFQNEVFNILDEEKQLNILEIINVLHDPNAIINKYEYIIGKENKDKNALKQISERLKKNLHIVISIINNSFIYRKLFIDYPLIVNNSNILYLNEYTENNLFSISSYVFDKMECLLSNNLAKLLI